MKQVQPGPDMDKLEATGYFFFKYLTFCLAHKTY